MNMRITRPKAKALGLTHYFTGGPCRNGHLSSRFVGNGRCVECHENGHEKRREHGRRWAAENPEKVREMQRRQYAANPEKTAERVRRRRLEKRRAQVLADVDCGLENAKANGTLLDTETALDLFKAHDNAFEFIEKLPDVVESIKDFDVGESLKEYIENLPTHG